MSFLETIFVDETQPVTITIADEAVFDIDGINNCESWHESQPLVSNCNQFVPNCDDESNDHNKPTRPTRASASSRNNNSSPPPPSSLHTLIGLISESDSVLLNDDTSKKSTSTQPETCYSESMANSNSNAYLFECLRSLLDSQKVVNESVCRMESDFTSISSSTLRIGHAAQSLDMKFTSLQAALDSMNQATTTTSLTHHIASVCAQNSCNKAKAQSSWLALYQDRKELQRQFNKRVKYEVNRTFGANYLAEHQVRELDLSEMHKIRKKVINAFAPFPLPVKVAWSNAMNSLRQDRHQLTKKKKMKNQQKQQQ